MNFKNFNLNIIIRIALIIVSSFLTAFLFYSTSLKLTTAFIFVITILIGMNLLFYIQKRNMKINIFFESINSDDYSPVYLPSNLGSSYDLLRENMNKVMRNIQALRKEKEMQFNYLQNVIQHVGIGIFVFDDNHKIEFFNTSIKRMFQIISLKKLEDLVKISGEFVKKILNLKSGDKELIKFVYEDVFYQLVVHATKFKSADRLITIVSIQNIHTELEQQELISWQKLIGVLRHEIMNSITPILSLSESLEKEVNSQVERLKELTKNNFSDLDDISTSIKTIRKRSEGLLHFVEKYKSLSKISLPDFVKVEVYELIQETMSLFSNELEQNKIELRVEVIPKNLNIIADRKLMEQVLINLIKNAIKALSQKTENKRLSFKSFGVQDSVIIKVVDNGNGIKKEVLPKIFIPFFTTKTEGNGIGLSIAKQVMLLHKGRISVSSEEGNGTEFRMIFGNH